MGGTIFSRTWMLMCTTNEPTLVKIKWLSVSRTQPGVSFGLQLPLLDLNYHISIIHNAPKYGITTNGVVT